jgi:hypothetical protein
MRVVLEMDRRVVAICPNRHRADRVGLYALDRPPLETLIGISRYFLTCTPAEFHEKSVLAPDALSTEACPLRLASLARCHLVATLLGEQALPVRGWPCGRQTAILESTTVGSFCLQVCAQLREAGSTRPRGSHVGPVHPDQTQHFGRLAAKHVGTR